MIDERREQWAAHGMSVPVAVFGAGLALLLAVPYPLFLMGLGDPWLAIHSTVVLIVTGMLGSVVAFVAAAVFLLVPEQRRRAGAILCGFAGALVIWVVFLGPLEMVAQDRAMKRCVVTGELLVTAIRAYEKDRGKPPEELAQLVPAFIDQVPSTGLGSRHDFRYRRTATRDTGGPTWTITVKLPVRFEFNEPELVTSSNGKVPGRAGYQRTPYGQWNLLRAVAD